MSVIFSSLVAAVIPKVRAALAGVTVSNRAAGDEPQVVIVQGPGVGIYNTLDDTTMRVNVYAPGEAEAEDLALLVRAVFESGRVVDGDPVTYARVSAGPVEVQNDLGLFQWYMVVDVTRRGSNFN